MRAEARVQQMQAQRAERSGQTVYTTTDLDEDVAAVQARARAEARSRLALVR